MAIKRILNKTPKTLLLMYEQVKFLKIERYSVSHGLPENHPVFTESSTINMENNGSIRILSETDFREQLSGLKQELQNKEQVRKSKADEMVDKEKARVAAEEHNRRVKIKKEAEKLAKDTSKGNATAMTLVEDEELTEVKVPDTKNFTTRVERPSELSAPSVEKSEDAEFKELVKNAVEEKKTENKTPKKRRRGRPKKEEVEESTEETSEETSEEDTEE